MTLSKIQYTHIKAGETEDRKGPESITNGPLRTVFRCFEINFFLFNSETE